MKQQERPNFRQENADFAEYQRRNSIMSGLFYPFRIAFDKLYERQNRSEKA